MDAPAVLTYPLITCRSCQGSGAVSGARCHGCDGVGSGYLIDGHLVVWLHHLDSAAIYEAYTRRTIRGLVRLTAFFLAAVGWIVVIVAIIQTASRDTMPFAFLYEGTAVGYIFWTSILADLFLYVSLARDAERTVRIPLRTYHEVPSAASVNATSAVPFSPAPRIDVWQTMTASTQAILVRAAVMARDERRATTVSDVCIASLDSERVGLLLARLGVSAGDLKNKILRSQTRQTFPSITEVAALMTSAYLIARSARQTTIDEGHLFAATVQSDPLVKEVCDEVNIDKEKIENVIAWQKNDDLLRRSWRRFSSRARLRPRNRLDRAFTGIATPTVDHFATDYTELAQQKQFLPAVIRPEITDNLLRILVGKRGVMLVGHPGVGKGGILEDIAERMVANDVPLVLQDKRLLSVSLARLVSGATPAEAEGRLLVLLAEAARSGNIVLVFEEVQGIIGITSGQEGSVDLANVLAGTLRRGAILCIATSTPQAYREALQRSPLAELLERVNVPEPDTNESIRIIESRVGMVEYRTNIYFSYNAIARLVELTSKYIHDRYLPKKALDLLDELALFVRDQRGERQVITGADVDAFLAAKLDIPIEQVTVDESDTLLHLEDRLHERVIGQEQAVIAIADALRRARTAVRDHKRPVASFLFLGPTGVGKTELAKAVAAVYFGDERRLVRLDMTEYQELTSLSRLIGEAGVRGVLTEAIRKNPFALLLLDEIEKAHHDVINVFLQVMDDARLTDATGETVDFTNVIIIATSNAGSGYIQEALRRGESVATIERTLLEKELREHFQPEFLNRFDGVIVFKPLDRPQIIAITKLLVDQLAQRLQSEHGVILEVTSAGIEQIATAGVDAVFGARPLRRVLQDHVDAEIAKLLLSGQLKRRDTVRLDGSALQVIKAPEL